MNAAVYTQPHAHGPMSYGAGGVVGEAVAGKAKVGQWETGLCGCSFEGCCLSCWVSRWAGSGGVTVLG